MVRTFNALPAEEMQNVDISILTGRSIGGRYNIMSSMEDGYALNPLVKRKEDNKTDNPIRRLRDKLFEPDEGGHYVGMLGNKEAGRELIRLLRELAEGGDIREVDLSDIKFALAMAFNHRFGFDINSKEAADDKQDLIKTIRELVAKGDTPEEVKELWIRGVLTALDEKEVAEYLKEVSIRDFNRIYYPAMEHEADDIPSIELMNWYKEGLAYRVGYTRESAMYNRLAYFYMWHFAGQHSIEQAKAYLQTIERKGILLKNPYEGFFGRKEHKELIEMILTERIPGFRRK